jgi:putative transposase
MKRRVRNQKPRGGRKIPGWSRTTDGRRMCDDEIREYLLGFIEGDGEFYGYLKLTHALRQNVGLTINKKKVYRLCKELRILRPQRKLKPRLPRRLARNCEVTGSNQHWATDIKYGELAGNGNFFYVASIIDIFDRCIVGTHVGLRCESKDILRVLKEALKSRGITGKGLILRSDNGPQFKGKVLGEGCRKLGVEQEFIPCKTPNMNAHIESFHSILESECMAVNRFELFGDAYREVHRFIRFYNSRRLHSGCGYQSPEAYYRANRSKTATVKAIAV